MKFHFQRQNSIFTKEVYKFHKLKIVCYICQEMTPSEKNKEKGMERIQVTLRDL